MLTRLIGKAAVLGGVQKYWQKVRSIQTANLIGLWRLNETAGSVAKDSSPQVNDGAYTGVDLANAAGPDGVLCPLFGAGDYVNLYSAALAADFNGSEGTMMAWVKVANAGVWTDGLYHSIFNLQVIGGASFIYVQKMAANNTLRFLYQAGGTFKYTDKTVSATGWMHLAITWSKTADEVKFYYNGVQEGATQTALGNWGANLLSNISTVIGAANTTPTQSWSGWLSLVDLWTKALTPAEVAGLAPAKFLP